MLNIIVSAAGVIAIVLAAFVVGREIIALTKNPVPKMENGDKRFGEIEMKKTRKIDFYPVGE